MAKFKVATHTHNQNTERRRSLGRGCHPPTHARPQPLCDDGFARAQGPRLHTQDVHALVASVPAGDPEARAPRRSHRTELRQGPARVRRVVAVGQRQRDSGAHCSEQRTASRRQGAPPPLIRSAPSDERSNSLGPPLMWETETHTSFRIWGPRDFFGARVPPWYLPTPPHAE